MTDNRTIEDLEDDVQASRHVDKRQKWILFWLAGIVTLLAAGLLALYIDTRGEAERSAEVAVAEQQEKVEVATEARQALCGDADQEIYDRELCEKWAGIAEQDPPPVAEAPAVVIGGPSRAAIVDAFREYCTQGNCKGQDGAEPTADDIAAAFARFCADGRCTGPEGATGPEGEPGVNAPPALDGVDGQDAPPPSLDLMLAAVTSYCADGSCAGPQGAAGPPPTEESIADSVAAYCSSGACTGPAGPPGPGGADGSDSTVAGPAGPAGPQGVSIVDVDCIGNGADSTWQITLSDGQILNGGGPCQATANPAPPTPEGP